MSDLISRKKAIYALADADAKKLWKRLKFSEIQKCLLDLPSAQPEIKPISYMECANAMLKMWIDNVLTDGEYNRIMDKLNSKHMADMRGEQDG